MMDVVKRLFNLQVEGKDASAEPVARKDDSAKKAEAGTRR
jgi:hypothetical protein